MKWRFEWSYRLGLAALLALALWSVWAGAQGTNAAPNVVTNAAPAAAPPAAVSNRLQSALAKLPAQALTFNLDHVAFLRENTFLNQPLWKYGASLIYLLLAFLAAKLVDWLVNVWLKRWAARTRTKHDDLWVELLRGPVKAVAFVIFLNIGLGIFDWPPRAQLFLSRGLILVVACSVTYLILSSLDLFLGLWREKVMAVQDQALADQLLPLVSK